MRRRSFLALGAGTALVTGCLGLRDAVETPREQTGTEATTPGKADTATSGTTGASTSPELTRQWTSTEIGATDYVRSGETLYVVDTEQLTVFDLSSDSVIRQFDLPSAPRGRSLTVDAGVAYCAGEVDNGEQAPLTAVDLTDGPLWTYRGRYSGASAPWVVGETVALASATTEAEESGENRSETVLLSAETGDVTWTVPGDELNRSRFVDSVAFDGRTLVVFADETHLFDVRDRSYLTTVPLDTGFAPPLRVGSHLYTGGDQVTKFNLDARAVVWESRSPDKSRASPTVASDRLLLATDDGVGAHDTETGNRQWFTKTGTSMFSPTVTGNGFVWAGDENGVIHALEPASGKIRLEKQLQRVAFDSEFGRITSLLVWDGSLYVGASERLTKLSIA